MLMAQILCLNSKQFYLICLLTLLATTVATLFAMWFATLWQGDELQTSAKFLAAYGLSMYIYTRFIKWLTA